MTPMHRDRGPRARRLLAAALFLLGGLAGTAAHAAQFSLNQTRVHLRAGHAVETLVLTNQEVGAAFNAVTLRIVDAFLGAPATDWLSAYAAAVALQKGDADEKWKKLLAARDTASRPSRPLSAYAGKLRDPWYGDVDIAREGGKLVMRFSRTPQLVGDLSHWQQDTFIVRWRERWLNADAFLTFSLKPDGTIRETRMEAISPLTDFSFDFHDLRLTPVGKSSEH